MTKSLAEILEDLHDLSEELRPHVEDPEPGSFAAAMLSLREELEEARADVEAYRAQNRELRAGVDRREASIKNQQAQIENQKGQILTLDESMRKRLELEESLGELHVLAARLGSLLERWVASTPEYGDELEAETTEALEELGALGPAPGTPVPLTHLEALKGGGRNDH